MTSRALLIRSLLTACLLFASVSAALAVGGGGGACGRCEIPYPDAYSYADSSGVAMTPADASSFCFDRLDTLPFGMEFGGYVIQWVGSPPATSEDTGRFYCHACINDLSGGSTGSLPIDQATWIALEAYPGRVSGIDTLVIDDETHGLGTGYLVTIVADGREGNNGRRAATIRIDPFTYEATVLVEASTSNR